MTLTLNDSDDMFLPSTALIRSFVGITAETTVYIPTSVPEERQQTRAEQVIKSLLEVKTTDWNYGTVRVKDTTTNNDVTTVIANWSVIMSIPHAQNWDEEQVEKEALDRVRFPSETTTFEASYASSRPAHEYLTESWTETGQAEDSNSDTEVVSQWIHDDLLVIISLVKNTADDSTTGYAVVQMAPPVPTPFPVSQAWMYAEPNVARADAKRFLLSIDGAFEQQIKQPVETVADKMNFKGEKAPLGIDSTDLTVETDTDETETVESLPPRPLSQAQVEEVATGYEKIHDEACHILVPETPIIDSQPVRELRRRSSNDIVSFTISTPDGFAVFRLQSVAHGSFEWAKAEGNTKI